MALLLSHFRTKCQYSNGELLHGKYKDDRIKNTYEKKIDILRCLVY